MKNKIKDNILLFITLVAFISLVIGICGLDAAANTILSFIICIISMGWLTLMGLANGVFDDDDD